MGGWADGQEQQTESAGGRTDLGGSEQPVRTLATVQSAQELANLTLSLSDVPSHAMTAWDTLRSGGVSHVIVHEAAWLDDRGPRTTAALTQLGATEIFREGSDVILRLR